MSKKRVWYKLFLGEKSMWYKHTKKWGYILVYKTNKCGSLFFMFFLVVYWLEFHIVNIECKKLKEEKIKSYKGISFMPHTSAIIMDDKPSSRIILPNLQIRGGKWSITELVST